MEFFTLNDFNEFAEIRKTTIKRDSPESSRVGNRLKDTVYAKTNYWAERLATSLAEYGFTMEMSWYWQISGKVRTYTWAKIYLTGDENTQVFFTVGVGSRFTEADERVHALEYKLDCLRSNKNKGLSSLQVSEFDDYIQDAAPGAKRVLIDAEQLNKYDWEKLIEETRSFIVNHLVHYENLKAVVWPRRVTGVRKFGGRGSDDNAYLTWMDGHPLGFVVNLPKFVLHKSHCMHITSTTGFKKGIFTENDTAKVCSNDLNALRRWFERYERKFSGEFIECGTCKPYAEKHVSHPVFLFPETVEAAENLFEGTRKVVTVNTYERNMTARRECLQKYGCVCSVCKIDFGVVYGEIGKGFIHVHHLKEISGIKATYRIDPISDLRPVCPNCHAMLHQRKPCYSIEELTDILNLHKYKSEV